MADKNQEQPTIKPESTEKSITQVKTDTINEKIDLIDRFTSSFLHDAVIKPKFLELLVFPFAVMFNPIAVLVLVYAIGYQFPKHNYKTDKTQEQVELYEYNDKPVNIDPLFYVIQYVAQVVVVLMLTTITKRLFKRQRPNVPAPAKRMVDFRTKETNGSMPSGDTAQAALFAFYIKFNFVHLFVRLGGDYFIAKFLTLVALARVFHHCHFFGDTIIGAMIGFLVAFGFEFYEIVLPLPFKLA
ncbi:membrane-associated phospholipid phosphatase [Stylonychia lemnae]|uniref:Membrane-associated phospholipid phosphatase n=1 Tax=Stylonychia lemnae TaxID=5949 RepID=A0A078ABP1_STYLE|nr:membrane-associated phospholipid phosphatase [Stylonychia lemnae]|eukprot:CDW79002.1 membrane-associated phospholipid phosphatase [Stylonychia lemnae]